MAAPRLGPWDKDYKAEYFTFETKDTQWVTHRLGPEFVLPATVKRLLTHARSDNTGYVGFFQTTAPMTVAEALPLLNFDSKVTTLNAQPQMPFQYQTDSLKYLGVPYSDIKQPVNRPAPSASDIDFKVDPAIVDGTSWHGEVLNVPGLDFGQLVRRLYILAGHPIIEVGDKSVVDVVGTYLGQPFTLYDWKRGQSLHIGSKPDFDVEGFVAALTPLLLKAEPQVLTREEEMLLEESEW
ncbi:Hypothetical protein POVN_LOCUS71 [uncultured virus]|nr:Hypothetical protein POVN_LOCUS71 [uncultured virus]